MGTDSGALSSRDTKLITYDIGFFQKLFEEVPRCRTKQGENFFQTTKDVVLVQTSCENFQPK